MNSRSALKNFFNAGARFLFPKLLSVRFATFARLIASNALFRQVDVITGDAIANPARLM